MGDIVMTGPALRALKETFDCRITLLTSKMGALITPHLPEIDETIICTLPWVKSNDPADAETLTQLVQQLKERQFDAAIIFTVYSQNPLPSAMLAFLAGIPLRLAYCRENPYELLTDWIPDEEPYTLILHQVERDLKLVQQINASVKDNRLQLSYNLNAVITLNEKLADLGIKETRPFLILHTGVSEKKREVPVALWISAANRILAETSLQIIITGAASEKALADAIENGVDGKVFNTAGLLSIEELIALIASAEVVVSVNTATAHIAAATQTPVVVLYALTNPQHYPWAVPNQVLTFSVQDELKSRNQVVNYVSNNCMEQNKPLPTVDKIITSVLSLLRKA
jgi:lipopolysaccharide heptosyltransferase II